MRTVRFELLRPEEILEEKRRFPVAYLPLGPLEWHGPHLPLGTDPLTAEAVARRVAEETGGVVMPTFFWGTERERDDRMLEYLGLPAGQWIVGMDFPKNPVRSLYVSEDAFASAVREYLRLLVLQGYRLVVIVNGHGGTNHLTALLRLAKEFTATTQCTVIHTMDAFADEDACEDGGHASMMETAMMRRLYPDSVDLSALPPRGEKLRYADYAIVDGEAFQGNPTPDFSVRDDPRDATDGEGGALVNLAVKIIKNLVLETWEKIRDKN
jgi:creatinine amidohydrolase